ncbi:hypothetical protein BamIOP4010DRAFT_1319 [Burkholderia ambifaria IOP40-10]|uniref:Uncharacterized protein n=2 Tax=Burkholderia ambifaria TaxID=152480 RepID=B1FBB0_9BURK|nr:hypothetical protein BamIOP4010DRAFT_1319 [Burkholderia ambifaria IOP40-10]
MPPELYAIVRGLNSIARQHGQWIGVNLQGGSPKTVRVELDRLMSALEVERRFYDALLSVESMAIGRGGATRQAHDRRVAKRAVVTRDIDYLGEERKALERLSAGLPVDAPSVAPSARASAWSQGRAFAERAVGAVSMRLRRRFPVRAACGDDTVDVSGVLPIQATALEHVTKPTAWQRAGAWGSHWLVHAGIQAVSKICGTLTSVALQHLPDTPGCIGGYFMVPLAAGASGAYVGWRLAGYVGDEDPGRRRVWAAVLSGAAGLCSVAELMADQPTACPIVIGGAMQHVVISWIEPLLSGALRDCGPRPVSSESVWTSLTPLAGSAGSVLTRAPLVVTRPVGSWVNALVVDLVGAIGHSAGDTAFRFWIVRRDVNAPREVFVHRAWLRWPDREDVLVPATASTAMSAMQILVARALEQGMRPGISMSEPGYPIASMTMSAIAHDLLHQPLVLCESVRMRSRPNASPVVEIGMTYRQSGEDNV